MPRMPDYITGLLPATAFVVASNAAPATLRQARILKARFGELIQICDGTADQVEIQAALNALPIIGTYKTGKLFLSEGTFYIAAPVAINNTWASVTIQGSGKSATVLRPSANTNILEVFGTALNSIGGMRICDLAIQQPGTATADRIYVGHGIRVGYVGRLDIERCFIWNLVGAAVKVEHLTVAPIISDCYIAYCGDDGVKSVNPTGLTFGAVHFADAGTLITDIANIQDTEFGANYYRDIYSASGVLNLTISRCYFEGNQHETAVYEPPISIEALGNFVRVKDNTWVWSGADWAAYLQGTHCVISGNTIWYGEGGGFRVAGSSVIKGNTVNGLKGTAYMCNGTETVIGNNVAVNCGITNNTNVIHAGGNRILVANNILTNGVKFIYLDYGNNCLVIGNTLVKGAAAVVWSIRANEAGENHAIHGNKLVGFAAADFQVHADNLVRNNAGYVTENSGTASVTGAVNAVNIAHGLVATPTRVFVQAQQGGQGDYWVSAKAAANFELSFTTQPGASTWYFDWKAQVREG